MRALNHKNIIRLHEVFETDNSLYMILDLLEGGQLYDKIKAKYRYYKTKYSLFIAILPINRFSIDEARHIMKGLIEGIAEMH